MTIVALPDIVGDNQVHPLSATHGARARRIWITASANNSAHFGAIGTVGAAAGISLGTAVAVFSASDADPSDSIDLTSVGVYVPSGTTVRVSYGL